jgi:methyl-accepting chemotaxis protein
MENVITIVEFLKSIEERLTNIEENVKEIKKHLINIETNTRENTDVAQKMSRYTAVLDFAEDKLTNSSLLSYFTGSTTIQDGNIEEEFGSDSNSDFDE